MKLSRFLRRRAALLALLALTPLFAAPAAHAFSSGDQVTGSIRFARAANYFDPANGFVPAGYENTAGPTVAISDSAVEFGYADGLNTDTADFNTPTMLTLEDVSQSSSSKYTETFAATTAGDFGGLTLVSSTFPTAPTFSVASNTLTINFAALGTAGTYTAVFSVNAVPEPSIWAALLGGAGLLAGARRLRRARRA